MMSASKLTFDDDDFRKNVRLFMIEHKVIHWLVIFIKKELADQKKLEGNMGIRPNAVDQGNFNPYLMEYAWALLMNLCLHDESWISCTENGPDLLNSACDMLQITQRKDVKRVIVFNVVSSS